MPSERQIREHWATPLVALGKEFTLAAVWSLGHQPALFAEVRRGIELAEIAQKEPPPAAALGGGSDATIPAHSRDKNHEPA